ncbi:DEHA2G20680p [Debaryomyces hansenii CBS767]|uniref:DEHA2G20680p n=1 Tax=Debaryomyces hansenii (strain ATCC 36239 / CBS 767 / BCRC 21394 / JCM 1990 / NBRC 0083 / IGC 2968) TaxID=284592 RepID=Q6BH80_DEBHA|nr:DEHA2G20680p [Debaryomyces hansenii CBS767]CAG90951.2 DEHA2G20680p [Debaryomyces hansenii CBS767]|eukprot:XP_462441.2 DEHA2G20680p [Debaryomyces hansenii CBS767]
MSTSTIQPQAESPFARRVSFNNLSPDYIDEDDLSTPYTKNNGQGVDIRFKEINYGSPGSGTSGPSLFKDFPKMYSGGGDNYTSSRKRYHLPDPPSKSILKNKLNPVQAQHNLEVGETDGINYHEDLNEIARSGTSAIYDSDDEEDDDEDRNDEQVEPGRRKSYVGMSDEELMALDPQYINTKSKVSDVGQFRFDSQKTYYLPSSRRTSANVISKATYPSSNENNYKSISLSVKHNDYDSTTASRTLLTVISGRKHTWNSLDWLLMIGNKQEPSFLNDGDYLVVTSFIPAKFISQQEKKKKRTADELLLAKCENLLNYITRELPVDLRVKITVEFITDQASEDSAISTKNKTGIKYMLAHIFRQYQPMLVIIGNKSTNLNFKYPLRMKRNSESKPSTVATGIPRSSLPSDLKRHSLPSPGTFQKRAKDDYMIKFSSYIIKYSTVPVIVVGNVTKFHQMPRNSSKSSGTSIYTSSNESIESYVRSPTEEKLTELDLDLKTEVNNLLNLDSVDKFQRILSSISDKSLSESNNYLEALKSRDSSSGGLKFDDSVIFNNKMHSIYNSQFQNRNNNQNNSDKMYKVKSMISYDEEEERKNDKLRNNKKEKSLNSINSTKSTKPDNASLGSGDEDKKPRKKSFWKKIGLKK